MSEIAGTMALDEIRYAQVWEDARVLQAALALNADDDVLSIGSAGDNVLALLLQGPRSITALDMSPAQSALVRLKLAAIRMMSRGEVLALIGLDGDPADRRAIYDTLRPALDDETQAFFDAHAADLEAGLVHRGRLERYFAAFREGPLSQIWTADMAARLMDAPDLDAQAALFLEEAFTPALQQALADFFGPSKLSGTGRDPAQFKYVDPGFDVGQHWVERTRHLGTQTRLRDNPYFEMFFTGGYRDLDRVPAWLEPSAWPRLKSLVERVEVVTDTIENALLARDPGAWSAANLSDIFEYMSPMDSDRLMALLAQRIRTGGRIAYWNLLVPRSCPASLAPRMRPRPGLGEALHRTDRVWFYRAFHIDEITAG